MKAVTLEQMVKTGYRRYFVQKLPMGYQYHRSSCLYTDPDNPGDPKKPMCIVGASCTKKMLVDSAKSGNTDTEIATMLDENKDWQLRFGHIGLYALSTLQSCHDEAAQSSKGQKDIFLNQLDARLRTFCAEHNIPYPGDKANAKSR